MADVTTTPGVRAGVLVWNQYTDWPAMRTAAVDAERLGYHTLWTWVIRTPGYNPLRVAG